VYLHVLLRLFNEIYVDVMQVCYTIYLPTYVVVLFDIPAKVMKMYCFTCLPVFYLPQCFYLRGRAGLT
jgi:hypothetical protein